CQQEDNWPRTF
nr:immunoglobulin light chain junction region [Macaca mulatta]MOV34911.1 immunoglobulin light chain junction region [Macaca mulatta]MOV35066.1 immunoglobulin light chain junction region [Macaca mulatta]MOV35526.1 immunoglobulin light chain junction region [Macaca mulatta]